MKLGAIQVYNKLGCETEAELISCDEIMLYVQVMNFFCKIQNLSKHVLNMR